MTITQNCRIRTVYCKYLAAIIVFYKFHFYQKKVRSKKIRLKDGTQTTVLYLLRKENPIVLCLHATIRLSHFGREFGKKTALFTMPMLHVTETRHGRSGFPSPLRLHLRLSRPARHRHAKRLLLRRLRPLHLLPL
jgi:hypothetical protein